MPYAPTVNDRSGEILAQHQINSSNMLAGAKVSSAETRAAGNEALAQGIMDGVTNLAGGITGGFAKAGQNKMTSDYLDSMAGHFSNTMGADGQTPLMSSEMLEKFSKGSLGAKQGMIVPLMAQYEQNLKNQYLAAQIAGFGQRQALQNQVPANQQPVSAGGGGAAPAASPMGGVNFNFVN
jgi:hypothetical protein